MDEVDVVDAVDVMDGLGGLRDMWPGGPVEVAALRRLGDASV